LKHHRFPEAAIVLAGANAAAEYFEPILCDRDQEVMIVAYTDDRLRLIELLWFPGCKSSVEVPMREIFRCTRESGGIILAHNHPSGNALPSHADTSFTKHVSLVAEALNITVLDHLILGAGKTFSFRQAGLL
jgi:DNA repair protein RadC